MHRLTVLAWLAADTGRFTGDLRAPIGRDLDELRLGAKDSRNMAVWACYDAGGGMVTVADCVSGQMVHQWPPSDNMADPRNLMWFADMVMQMAPAEQYALIVGGHGSGPKQQDVYPSAGNVDTLRGHVDNVDTSRSEMADLAFDDGSQAAMGITQLGEVCRHIADRGRLAIAVLDSCLMATVEVCEALVGTCDVLVASPEAVPGEGLPYTALLREWDATVLLCIEDTAQRMGQDAVKVFADHYGKTSETASIVAVDMAKVPGLLAELDGVGDALMAWDRESTFYMMGRHQRAGNADFLYLGACTYPLWVRPKGLKEWAATVVLEEWNSLGYGGLTVYLPERGPFPAWYLALPIASRPWGAWVARQLGT